MRLLAPRRAKEMASSVEKTGIHTISLVLSATSRHRVGGPSCSIRTPWRCYTSGATVLTGQQDRCGGVVCRGCHVAARSTDRVALPIPEPVRCRTSGATAGACAKRAPTLSVSQSAVNHKPALRLLAPPPRSYMEGTIIVCGYPMGALLGASCRSD